MTLPVQARCFVCDLVRTKLDHLGGGFDKHIASEHNPRLSRYFFYFRTHQLKYLMCVKRYSWHREKDLYIYIYIYIYIFIYIYTYIYIYIYVYLYVYLYIVIYI